MVCKGKWKSLVTQLEQATQLPGAAVDGAPRCVKPECNRPLMKDGACPVGHVQTAGLHQGDHEDCPLQMYLRLLSGGGDFAVTAGSGGEVVIAPAQGTAFTTAEREFLVQLGLEPWAVPIVVPDAAVEDVAQRVEQAWELGMSAQGHALWGEEIRQKCVRVILNQEPALAGCNFTSVGANLAPPGVVCFTPGKPRWQPGAEEERWPHYFDPDHFEPEQEEALRRLGVDPEAMVLPPGDGRLAAVCVVPPGRVNAIIAERVGQVRDGWGGLLDSWADLRRERGQLPAVEVAQRYALPLWTSAWAQVENADLVQELGLAGKEETRTVLRKTREETAEILQGLSPAELLQVFAAQGWEERVIKLLRFPGVRAALFDPAGPADLLTDFQATAAQVVQAVRACDLVEQLQSQPLPPPGKRGPAVAQLVEAGRLLSAALPPEDSSGKHPNQIWDAKQAAYSKGFCRIVAAIPTKQAGASGRAEQEGARLENVERAAEELWNGPLEKGLTTDDLRGIAVQEGMVGGRWARRDRIVRWLKGRSMPTRGGPWYNRWEIERGVIDALLQDKRQSLLAVDRTGQERTYKVGQAVRVVSRSGASAESGAIAGLRFGAYRRLADGQWDVQPLAQVRFADGSVQDLQVSEFIEPANKK